MSATRTVRGIDVAAGRYLQAGHPSVFVSDCDNAGMNTSLDDPALYEADAQAVMDHALHGKPLDPEVARRVDERSRRATEEVRRRMGTVNVAVDLVRASRDEE